MWWWWCICLIEQNDDDAWNHTVGRSLEKREKRKLVEIVHLKWLTIAKTNRRWFNQRKKNWFKHRGLDKNWLESKSYGLLHATSYTVWFYYTHTHHSHMSMTTIYIEICVKDWMMLSAFVITNHTHTLLNRTQSSRHSINICSLSSLLNLLVEHLWFLITTRLQLRSLKGEPYISHLLIVITAYRSSLIVLAYKVQRERERITYSSTQIQVDECVAHCSTTT